MRVRGALEQIGIATLDPLLSVVLPLVSTADSSSCTLLILPPLSKTRSITDLILSEIYCLKKVTPPSFWMNPLITFDQTRSLHHSLYWAT